MVQLMMDGSCPPGWKDGAHRQQRSDNDRPVAAAGYQPKKVTSDPSYFMTSVLYFCDPSSIAIHCRKLLVEALASCQSLRERW